MDARWGFHQLNLSEETINVFTLVTNFGTYCYKRLVMGWINATAEFQRHMNVTMGDALWRCAIVTVDDICVASETMDDHKAHLEEVFSRLASRGHSLKPEKGEAATGGGGISRAHLYAQRYKYCTGAAECYYQDALSPRLRGR